MQLSPSIFKAYDIRGIVPSTVHADMARALGVTRATIGHAVGELTAAGLVLETPTPTPDRIGRPGVALHLNPQGALFIGVEIDTRAISGVLLDLNMQVVARHASPTGEAFHDPQALQAASVRLGQILAEPGHRQRIRGIGLRERSAFELNEVYRSLFDKIKKSKVCQF